QRLGTRCIVPGPEAPRRREPIVSTSATTAFSQASLCKQARRLDKRTSPSSLQPNIDVNSYGS
ncbi:uncharacterized protein L969DRAFT_50504, partial [Mixia osmundae IAM 14324]|uniref:uncharacterized protein n=1 Tax=Mixia osmundae (strain CBS 9802 / IAM 14324 / JCM 22182 / KY 12970) TaxID=764103 RepID=UPI0004A54A75